MHRFASAAVGHLSYSGSAVPELDLVVDPVSEFPQFNYSMKQVLRAGEALKAGGMIWTPETADGIVEVFKIANNFRDSHAYPMRKIRSVLYGQMRRRRIEGNTVARLKRMPSIRRKLETQPHKLNQIQDLGGCRAILPSIKDVSSLVEAMRNITHDLHHEDAYIDRPKPDGYRCHHMVFKFRGTGDENPYNGRRIEVQIRTRLQHSWATAVEAVGLFRKENMKGGQGSPDWLRLFKLMSAELAAAESCPEGANVPDRSARVREIISLDKKLNAANTLDNLSQAVRYTDRYYGKAIYYLIKYDRLNRVVNVEPYFGAMHGVKFYDEAEVDADRTGNRNVTAVLVEADGIAALKAAYPNYFGDVQLFKMQLKNITEGKEAAEYVMPPQVTVPQKPRQRADLSWFKRRIRWT